MSDVDTKEAPKKNEKPTTARVVNISGSAIQSFDADGNGIHLPPYGTTELELSLLRSAEFKRLERLKLIQVIK